METEFAKTTKGKFEAFIKEHLENPALVMEDFEDGPCVQLEKCEMIIGWLAAQLRKPEPHTLEMLIYAADREGANQDLNLLYDEKYRVTEDGFQPVAAHVMMTPGYQGRYHNITHKGKIKTRNTEEADQLLQPDLRDRYKDQVQKLKTEGIEAFKAPEQGPAWQAAPKGSKAGIAAMIWERDNRLELLDRIRHATPYPAYTWEVPAAYHQAYPE